MYAGYCWSTLVSPACCAGSVGALGAVVVDVGRGGGVALGGDIALAGRAERGLDA